MLWGFPLPIIFALLLNELRSSKYKRIVQTVCYLPHFIPTVIVVGLLVEFFAADGIINEVVKGLGIKSQRFLGTNRYFRSLYIGSGLWTSIGFNSIVYLAALTALDPGLYEAATIDGASRFQRVLYITLPGILPTIATLFILNLSGVLSVGFEKVFLMYSPGCYEVADVFSTYVYRRGMEGLEYGYGAAVDIFNAVVSLVLVIAANILTRKAGQDGLF